MPVQVETKPIPIGTIDIEDYGPVEEERFKRAVTRGCNQSNGGLNVNILREIAKMCKVKGRSKIKRPALEKALLELYFPVTVKVRPVKPVKLVKPMPVQKSNEELTALYESLMSGIQHQTLDSLTTSTKNPCLNTKIMARHHKRLATDSTFLCTYGSSVFIRASESDMSTIQFIISGPKGTPYQNGLFHFTLHMEAQFPTQPPVVQILNTRCGTIRHNPNLYACGKVCLSILNTWSGGAQWSNKTSLSDVIMGIQNYVFSEYPWDNEPGHNIKDKRLCKAYNHIIRLSTMTEAMLGMMRDPPEGFTDVVLFHFYGPKRGEILAQIKRWQSDLSTLNSTDINGYMQSQTHYKNQQQFQQLFTDTVKQIEELYKLVLGH